MTQTSVVAATAKALVADPKKTIADVLAGIAGAGRTAVSAVVTPLPKKVIATVDQRVSLSRIAEDLEAFPFPEDRRELTESEKDKLLGLAERLEEVKSLIEKANDSIRTTSFNHFDAVAVREGKIAGVARDPKTGWLILEDKESLAHDGHDIKITREVSRGAVEDPTPQLALLDKAGKIEHQDFLDSTKLVRVLDSEGLMKVIDRNPSFAEKIKDAITVKASKISKYNRANR